VTLVTGAHPREESLIHPIIAVALPLYELIKLAIARDDVSSPLFFFSLSFFGARFFLSSFSSFSTSPPPSPSPSHFAVKQNAADQNESESQRAPNGEA